MMNKIMNIIKQENISMRSRYYFVARSSMWALAAVLVFASIVYLLSLIFFIWNDHALGTIALFGSKGIGLMLFSMPWMLILATIALVITLELLAAKFSFVYKRPLVYSLLILLVVLIAVSSLVARTAMHDRIAGPMHRHYAEQRYKENMYIGIIVSVRDNSATLKTRSGATIHVNITNSTRIPRHFELKTGEKVMVIIDDKSDSNEALGIRPVKKGKGRMK